ncbi:MAG: biotin/lipoate--protein ligase family protein [Gammaproteobacteria bacterium]
MPQADLPRLYELTAHEHVDSLLLEARRMARAGADEGTVVWALEQDARAPNPDGGWTPQPGGLACAFILRPEDPAPVAAQIGLVATVALTNAVAELVAPMTTLHCGWPGDIVLGGRKAGQVTLDAAVGDAGDVKWLNVLVEVNVRAPVDQVDLSHVYLQFDGHCDVTPQQLLEQFSREFLTWLDRWANEGFASIRTAWLHRAGGAGQPVEVPIADGTLAGTLTDLDADGRLVVETDAGARRLSLPPLGPNPPGA